MSSQIPATSIKISQLGKFPISAIIVSKFDILRFEKIVKDNPDELPVISVGRISDKLYPMSHMAVVEACRNTRVGKILVDIKEFETKQEFLIHQMRFHALDQPINPLKIRHVIDDLCSTGMSVSDALRQTLLNETTLSKIMSIPLTEKTETRLNDFIEGELSEKLPANKLVIPYYVFSKIGKLPEELQLAGVDDFINLTLIESEINFSWPTMEQMSFLFKSLTDKKVECAATVATIDEKSPQTQLDSIKQSQNPEKQKTSKPAQSKKSKPRQNRDTKTLLRQTRDSIIITNESDGSPEYIVNVRDGTAHKVSKSDDDKSFTLSSNTAKKIISIPNDVSRHHDLENRVLHNRNFSSITALDSQIEKLQNRPRLKLTLFWSSD